MLAVRNTDQIDAPIVRNATRCGFFMAGFGLPELSDWMQRWVSDLAAVRLGGRVRFFPAQESVLAALASRMSVAAASGCYNELAQIHKVSRHPLSLRLVLEDMLMRYARAIAGARG